jgi:hypothetical protein
MVEGPGRRCAREVAIEGDSEEQGEASENFGNNGRKERWCMGERKAVCGGKVVSRISKA